MYCVMVRLFFVVLVMVEFPGVCRGDFDDFAVSEDSPAVPCAVSTIVSLSPADDVTFFGRYFGGSAFIVAIVGAKFEIRLFSGWP